MTEMILIWGRTTDPPLSAVGNALSRRGANWMFLDQNDALETTFDLLVSEHLNGKICSPAGAVDLETVTAFYLRPDDTRQLFPIEEQRSGEEAFAHAMALEDALLSWSELTSAKVLNRPSAMASNSSKPFQAIAIVHAGFSVPETLITTDKESALSFWKEHGEVIYKSVSGVRSIVSRLSETHHARFDDISSCPTQLQQYISGRDIRVHVIGETVFASEILSDSDDYRYAAKYGGEVDIRSCELPEKISRRCISLTRSLGLHISGVDLRISSEGVWYCFEVNPSPGFTYYENHTHQPIAQAIADYMACT